MAKQMEPKNKNKQKNFNKYCYAVNYIGKKVIVHLLKWLYKGDLNYLDHLCSLYEKSDIRCVVSSSKYEHLRSEYPFELGIPQLHIVMQLVCDYLNDENDNQYEESLSQDILKLVLTHINLGTQRQRFTGKELDEHLAEFQILCESLLQQANNLTTIQEKAYNKVHDEVHFGLLCLYHDYGRIQCNLPSARRKEYTDKLIIARKEALAIISKSPTLKKKDEDTSYREVLEHRVWPSMIRFKREERLKAAGAKEKNEEEEAKEMTEGKESSINEESRTNEKNSVGKAGSLNLKAKKTKGSSASPKKSTSKSPVLEEQVESTSCEKAPPKGGQEEASSNNSNELLKLPASFFLNVLSSPAESKDAGVSLGETLSSYMDKYVLFKQHQKYSRKPGETMGLGDLFRVQGMNADTAEIIMLSGEVGTGKTMLLQYISEKWKRDQAAIDKLASFKFLLSIDLKKNNFSTFGQWVLNSVKERVDHELEEEGLVKAILESPLLLILDDYDESSAKSIQLVGEVLNMKGSNLHVIITSRPHYVDSIYRLITKIRRKYVSHLILNSFPVVHHKDIACQLIESEISSEAYSHNFEKEKLKEGLISRLPKIYEIFGEDMCNPLFLKIITKMWIQCPELELQ